MSCLAMALFATSVPLIRFAAEVKQYECDATAAIVLLLLALRLRQPERLRAASADSFEVAPMPSARPGCRPWIRPSPLDRL